MDIHETVQIIPWQEAWERIFEDEKKAISDAFAGSDISISVRHIGSTSVRGMDSKPILDILACPGKEEEQTIRMRAVPIRPGCGKERGGNGSILYPAADRVRRQG